jgi:hypothetical protein
LHQTILAPVALQTADEVSKLNATDMLPWQIKAFKDILELFAPDADEDSSDNETEGKEFVDDDAINLEKPGNVRMDDWTKFINKLVTDLWLKVIAALQSYILEVFNIVSYQDVQ